MTDATPTESTPASTEPEPITDALEFFANLSSLAYRLNRATVYHYDQVVALEDQEQRTDKARLEMEALKKEYLALSGRLHAQVRRDAEERH